MLAIPPRERLAALAEDVGRHVTPTLVGLVRRQDYGRVSVLYHLAGGLGAQLLDPNDLPAAFIPSTEGPQRLDAAGLVAHQERPVEAHLLVNGVQHALTLPFPAAGGGARLWVATTDPSPLTADRVRALGEIAVVHAPLLCGAEDDRTTLARLRRMEVAAELLPALQNELDLRQVFDRLAAISRRALPHDTVGLGLFSEDLAMVTLFAQTGALGAPPNKASNPYPPATTRAWQFHVLDDLTAVAIEANDRWASLGLRASLRLPIWFDGQLIGGLNFMSLTAGAFTSEDVVVGARIAEYVALALSHQRLAEDSRQAAALRERTASLEMLDGLLGTLAGVLDIREVFTRVSEIAARVLPHDAMGLPMLTEDGEHIIPYATVGLAGIVPPIQQLPPKSRFLVTEPWESIVIDDITLSDELRASSFADAGFRSSLRVPVRVDGKLAAIVGFFSRRVAAYTQADALIAKRIADHIALALSHQRLGDEIRRTEALRAQAANLELLDELLQTLTGDAALEESFERASSFAKKVIAYDAVVLPVLLADGTRVRFYANVADGAPAFPEVDVPEPLRRSDWEYDIVDDMREDPVQRTYPPAQIGYRSALRVPIRFDGKLVAGLGFFSLTPGRYQQSDILVARRIADRLALSLARESGLAASRRADEATARAAKLEARVRELTNELDARTGYRRVVGASAEWRQVLTQATQVAATDTTALLLGESGTGKEVVARFLHRASARKSGPFLALNCAALPEQLLEAELFGYERGAFTGAAQSKPGQLEQAAGGTLFLDEVAEMSPSAQAKFLRVLQEREFQRLGGTRVLRTDARIVAATNRDLQRAISLGQFREDLYYRLNVFAIRLPPLRARRDDVLPLSEAFLADIARGLGRPPAGISRDARQRLVEYDWPGNVRELRNVLERAAILCDGGLITSEHLSLTPRSAPVQPLPEPVAAAPRPAGASAVGPSRPTSASDLQSMERTMIEQALHNARFNKSKAAKALGLTRQQLYVRMRRYGLE